MKMNRIIHTISLLLFAALLFGGCSKSEGGDNGGIPEGCDTFGYVTDNSGAPIQGVVVSDGYTCTQTDAQGLYKLTRNTLAYYVYYSIPAGYEVNIGKTSDMPEFYSRLAAGTARYDFQLKPLAAPEKEFRLVCIGDPQVNDAGNVSRFNNETVADMKSYLADATVPCYAIALGDLVNNKWNLFPNMFSAMQKSKTSLPVFQTIGNHDHDFNAKTDFLAQRTYEALFGPVNYSFDRGDVHIISMDNVIHGCGKSDNYEAGFLEWQYKWLQQDLSYVPKDKKVILCVHIPFRGGAASGGSSMNKDKYYTETLQLLSEYSSATIMSAHTHSNINYIHKVNGKEIYEHITGTTCGAWWKSTVCTEGTPNGYAVYDIDGAKITEWIYKPVKYDADFQIRLYRASDSFVGGTSSYRFSKTGANQIVANIWNSDPSWTVSVYENGSKTGTMTRYTDRDAWTVAYHVGSLQGSSSYNKTAEHMYWYQLQDANAAVRVEAVDRFGNTYTQTEFTDPNTNPAGY